MIQVTHAAIMKAEELLGKHQDPMKASYIRLHMGIGWGGPRLELTLEESAAPSDHIFEVKGMKFIIAENKKAYFSDTKLDYVRGFFGDEFKILRM